LLALLDRRANQDLEKFDQAILDYKSALDIKVKLLPLENRQIAEAHFRLSLAYDMTSGKLENQIEHAEKALESVKKRLDTLKELLPKAPETKPPAAESDAKGKGKATTVQENPLGWTPKVESLESMTKSEIEAEIKDVTSLSEELQMKVCVVLFKGMDETLTSGQLEDIRAIPADGAGGTTMDRVGRELDEELKNSGFGAPLAADQPVNDLTSMVKKKKPKPAATVVNPLVPIAAAVNPLVPDAASLPSLGKRKAEEDPDRDEKKKRVE
jgi:HAT1-interacting factor 1